MTVGDRIVGDRTEWLGLMIGNSRLHWALFEGSNLRQTWDTPHLEAIAVPESMHHLPLWIASVVPSQTALWQNYPHQLITLEQIPLQGMYDSLGIDRALAAWGAVQKFATPVLVIDAGTALTFTAVTDRQFIGGAIVGGLQTQMRSLTQNTAALPPVELNADLPDRWALTTTDAILSGVIYTVLSTIHDYGSAWLERYPDGAIVLTGGDGDRLMGYLQERYSAIASQIHADSHLIFRGMAHVRVKMHNSHP
jgi:type III pantothenate kinase